jgi:hypothetical protein
MLSKERPKKSRHGKTDHEFGPDHWINLTERLWQVGAEQEIEIYHQSWGAITMVRVSRETFESSYYGYVAARF